MLYKKEVVGVNYARKRNIRVYGGSIFLLRHILKSKKRTISQRMFTKIKPIATGSRAGSLKVFDSPATSMYTCPAITRIHIRIEVPQYITFSFSIARINRTNPIAISVMNMLSNILLAPFSCKRYYSKYS